MNVKIPHPVQQSFNRAAPSYAANADLQRTVAGQLLQNVQSTLPENFCGYILDAGCGTGYDLSQLRSHYPKATLIGIDFAIAMLRQIDAEPLRIHGDLQQLPIADHSVDLYVSNLAWQWCDLSQAITEALRVLKPSGHLWLATLVHGTFDELRLALDQAGLNSEDHLLSQLTEMDILATFNKHLQYEVTIQRKALTIWHPDFSTLRRSIRKVGANHLPTSPGTINRTKRQRLIDAYEKQQTSHGLPLTYQVLTIHARRP